MRIYEQTWRQILLELGAAPIESGGILGRRYGDVCAFFLDPRGGAKEYIPDVSLLNRKLEQWAEDGISFAGIVHSHPNGVTHLSREDMRYGERIAKAVVKSADQTLYFPVISPFEQNIFVTVHAYCNGRWRKDRAEIVNR